MACRWDWLGRTLPKFLPPEVRHDGNYNALYVKVFITVHLPCVIYVGQALTKLHCHWLRHANGCDLSILPPAQTACRTKPSSLLHFRQHRLNCLASHPRAWLLLRVGVRNTALKFCEFNCDGAYRPHSIVLGYVQNSTSLFFVWQSFYLTCGWPHKWETKLWFLIKQNPLLLAPLQ